MYDIIRDIISPVFYNRFFTTQTYIVLKTCSDYPLITADRRANTRVIRSIERKASTPMRKWSSQRLARRDENCGTFSRVPSQKRLRRTVRVTTDRQYISLSLFPCFPRSYPWKSARRIKEPRKRTDRLARPRVHYSNRRGGDRWRWSWSRVLYTPRPPRCVCPQIEFPRVFIY